MVLTGAKNKMLLKILIVDDEKNNLRALARMLNCAATNCPFNLELCSVPELAVKLCESQVFDLIISDQRMPFMSGTELFEKLAVTQKKAHKILLSAYADFNEVIKSFNAGEINQFMSKPWDDNDLLSVIDKLTAEPRKTHNNFHGIWSKSEKMTLVFSKIEKAAKSNLPVFIYGETGTGKELSARALHEESCRKNNPFLPFNCANFSETLMESQLFGHKKGAFTGADKDTKGLLEEAGSGTLFLDETTTIPLSLQAKLLRVIQEREFSPVGSHQNQPFEAQIITASSTRLSEAVANGQFREDLRYRFEVIPLDLPPLRDRGQDALHLFERFLSEVFSEGDCRLTHAARDVISSYAWPGNIRQCQNAAHYTAAMADSGVIDVTDLPDYCRSIPPPRTQNDREKVEKILGKEEIILALENNNNKKGKTATELGVSRMTLWRKLKQYGLEGDVI